MNQRIELDKWKQENDQYVKLTYKDNENVFVSKKDFDRAFGAIVSSSKEDVKRDFAVDAEIATSVQNSAPKQEQDFAMRM